MALDVTTLATQLVEAGVETAEAALTTVLPHLPIESLIRLGEAIAALVSNPSTATLEAATIAADDTIEAELPLK